MNSYLVRIYRKAENNPRMLVGVVEEVGGNDKKAFHNLHELWDILKPVKRTAKKNINSKHGRQGSLFGKANVNVTNMWRRKGV